MNYNHFNILVESLLYLYPLALLLLSYWDYKKNKPYAFLNSSFFLLILIIMLRVFPWKNRPLLDKNYPYYLLIFLISITIIFVKSFNVESIRKISKKQLITFVILMTITIPITIVSLFFFNGGPASKAVNVSFPLRNGSYFIAHGGNNPIINHHYSYGSQKYALDIIKICKENIFKDKSKNEYFCIWDRPLYAVCNGVVSKTESGIYDNRPFVQMNKKAIRGNYIYLTCDSGISIMYAHIRSGSIKVKAGDRVDLNSVIGHVGNSGNTTEPHLHIQAANIDGSPAVLSFNGKTLMRNDIYEN